MSLFSKSLELEGLQSISCITLVSRPNCLSFRICHDLYLKKLNLNAVGENQSQMLVFLTPEYIFFFTVPPNVNQNTIVLSNQNSAGFSLTFSETQSASYYIVTATPVPQQNFSTVVQNVTDGSVTFDNLDYGLTYDVSFVAVNDFGQSGAVVASPQPQTSQ